jgi:hypothetical protein
VQDGRDFEFSFITKPLEPFRNRVVLISGLDMPEAMATDEEPGGDHARGAVLLSGAKDVAAAQAFLAFLKGPKAAAIMRGFGYEMP